MYKDEVVKIMSDTVEDFNRFLGERHGYTSEQMEEVLSNGHNQLMHVNGLIYDTLKEHGIIQ